jgi:D-cysteine desulfhydrase
VLAPQPWTPHAEQMLRAIVALGVEIHPASSVAAVPLAFARAVRAGDHVIPPGGSTPLGALGYLDAVGELCEQIGERRLPVPDVIVVALGSGGTAAGLLAGLTRYGLGARLVAVQTVGGRLAQPYAVYLAGRALLASGAGKPLRLEHFSVERGQLGGGYGVPTPASERAARRGAGVGLATDPTYTAKALAHALELVGAARRGRAERVLYWHTLSTAPLSPLLAAAPSLAELPAAVRRLLVPLASH